MERQRGGLPVIISYLPLATHLTSWKRLCKVLQESLDEADKRLIYTCVGGMSNEQKAGGTHWHLECALPTFL